MTLTAAYIDPDPQVIDDEGDVWTRAEDGRYARGTVRLPVGQLTLSEIQRHYGLFWASN